MLYNFYNGYDIDDSAIGCGRIIQVDCDGLHTYVNPCDLINACVAQLPEQLTKQCIVDFFNTTIDTTPVGYFLRVNGSHCLEAVPLSINDSDELVGCNTTDTPGYLGAKIVGSTNAGWTVTVNVIGPMGNQQVQIGLTAPDCFLCVEDDPTCDGAYLRGNLDGSTYRDCDGGDNGYRAVRYASADLSPILTTNLYKSFFFTTSTSRGGTAMSNTPSMDIFAGETSMNGSGTYDGMIRIPKDGMYKVRMKGEAVINNGVSRIRLFLGIPRTTNPKILIDSKYGGETAFPGSFHCAPYQSAGGTEGLESITVTLNGERLVYLKSGEYIAMGCKVDTRDCNGVAPDVSFRRTVYELYDVGPGGASTEVPYAGPGISFGVEYYSAHNHGSTF